MQFAYRRHEYLGDLTVLGRNGLRALVALTRPAALFVFLLLLAGHSFAGNAVLTWDPVVANPVVTGYKVHHGPAAGNYTTSIDVGNVTSYSVPNLTEGATYHFAVTAYNAAGTQSGFSNDVLKLVPYRQSRRRFQCKRYIRACTAGDELHQQFDWSDYHPRMVLRGWWDQ